MSIQAGDIFLYTPNGKKPEHCVVIEIKYKDHLSEGHNMWKLFILETGEYDQEYAATLEGGHIYVRVV